MCSQRASRWGVILRGLPLLLLFIGGIVCAQSIEGAALNSPPGIEAQTASDGVSEKPCRQGCQVAVPKPAPDSVIYYFFLLHVGSENEEVQRALAEGEDVSKIRRDYQNAVHL